MSNWIILCPGPSLRETDIPIDRLKESTIVAVNGAIVYAHDVADWWAFMDPEVFDSVSRLIDLNKLSKRTKIWSYWGIEDMGLSHDGGRWSGDTLSSFRLFQKEVFHREENPPDIKKQFPESVTPFYSYEYIPWNICTMFSAISLAYKKGAKHIQIYGADLKGRGYFHGGLCNMRMRHDEKRWSEERILFSYIQEACRREGVEVIR